MSNRYSTYPAAPTALVSAVAFAAQLPNITDMRLCRDNSVVLELAVNGEWGLNDANLIDLSNYFGVDEGDISVQPGDDADHLSVEVWGTDFDFSDYFPKDPVTRFVEDAEFTSEHIFFIDMEPISVLVHFDPFFDRYYGTVPGIPGGDLSVSADDLDEVLALAKDAVEQRLEEDREAFFNAAANLFDVNECDFDTDEEE